MSTKAPAHEVRLGLIKATIWANKTCHGTKHVVSVCRLFKNGSEWKESTRFDRDDLLPLRKVLDQAHTWIFAEQQRGGQQEGGDE